MEAYIIYTDWCLIHNLHVPTSTTEATEVEAESGTPEPEGDFLLEEAASLTLEEDGPP